MMEDEDIFEVILDTDLQQTIASEFEDEQIRQYCEGVRARETDKGFMNAELLEIQKAWEQVESAIVISGLLTIDSAGYFSVGSRFRTPAARAVLRRLSRPLSLSKRILHFLTAERV